MHGYLEKSGWEKHYSPWNDRKASCNKTIHLARNLGMTKHYCNYSSITPIKHNLRAQSLNQIFRKWKPPTDFFAISHTCRALMWHKEGVVAKHPATSRSSRFRNPCRLPYRDSVSEVTGIYQYTGPGESQLCQGTVSIYGTRNFLRLFRSVSEMPTNDLSCSSKRKIRYELKYFRICWTTRSSWNRLCTKYRNFLGPFSNPWRILHNA